MARTYEIESGTEAGRSFIAAGIELEANVLQSAENIVVNGIIKGRLKVAKDIELLPAGVIIGDIYTENAVISGNVKGVIYCGGYLEITQTANIEGDVFASSIEVEHGATINGIMKINPAQIDDRGKAVPLNHESEAATRRA